MATEETQGQVVRLKTKIELETDRLARENADLTRKKNEKEAYVTQLERNVDLRTGLQDVNKRIKDAGGGNLNSLNLGILKNKTVLYLVVFVIGTILLLVVTKKC